MTCVCDYKCDSAWVINEITVKKVLFPGNEEVLQFNLIRITFEVLSDNIARHFLIKKLFTYSSDSYDCPPAAN